MTKEELEKYTVDFMNNETGLNRSNINSLMGRMLIKHAEVFQKRIAELEAQIEKMKSDVIEEIGFAKNFDELHTYNVLNNLLNRWEIKEK